MSGTISGGHKAAATNYARYGLGFYRQIGLIGGAKSRGGGFGSDKVGADGLTGAQRAREVGAIGGAVSRRKIIPVVLGSEAIAPTRTFWHKLRGVE